VLKRSGRKAILRISHMQKPNHRLHTSLGNHRTSDLPTNPGDSSPSQWPKRSGEEAPRGTSSP